MKKILLAVLVLLMTTVMTLAAAEETALDPGDALADQVEGLHVNIQHEADSPEWVTNLPAAQEADQLFIVAAMLAAYPVLYYDGELNTYYYDIIKDLTPMGIVKKLENEGYDLSSMLDNLTGGRLPERVNVITLALALTTLNEPLLEWGTNVKELTQIASDSGLELSDMVTIINYLQSKNR